MLPGVFYVMSAFASILPRKASCSLAEEFYFIARGFPSFRERILFYRERIFEDVLSAEIPCGKVCRRIFIGLQTA